MQDKDIDSLVAAIAALEGQRGLLGGAVVDMAIAPLRARLATLQRPAGLRHRQVTVLFADVVGSTAMADGLEAEDTLDVLGSAMRRMADIVQAHQGRVLRFTGDGVKAAFGMDEAREDDAERAVRAGLAMLTAGLELAEQARRRHGVEDFAMRVGLHTGDVALGAGIDADNTAMGVSVNIAARMEQSATPGTLRISHETWSQVRGLFDAAAQPPLLVKGIEAPMKTYLVRAALDRSVASVERGLQGLRTPMVGRQAELQRLRDTVSRARETGQLQALTLLGDAGLGKSRLLREWMADPAVLSGCRVLTVRSQPDGLLRPWGLLRSLLAVQCGVADTDSADVARRKVVEALSPCFDDRGERQAQLIGQLSGLDFGDSPHLRGLDPRSLRDQAFAAFRSYLQGLAAQGGTLPVLIVEDLHWADDGSLDLLQHLLERAAEVPLALVMTGRPALLARRPEWGTPDTRVPLSPLAAAHSDELVQTLLQRLDAVPAQLTKLIVGQAEGNPYYMEELVRRLVDDGVITVGEAGWTVQVDRLQTVRLPGTLVGLLQARLDALPVGERQAARQASVIGHVFWDDALQALDASAPQALPALQRAAFVRPRGASDFEGTTERQFDHHLLHQVTYDTLMKAERRLGHGAAARWLTERTKGRAAEFLAMTGEHAERAGETALAIDCFDQAAKEARKRYGNTAVVAYLRRALALLDESDPARSFDLLGRLAAIADTGGNRTEQDATHREMAAWLARHPDDARQAELWWCMGLLALRLNDPAAAELHSRQAFELAERCGAAETASQAQANLAWLQITRNDHTGAGRHIELGMHWAGKLQDAHLRAETEAKILVLSPLISIHFNRFNEARESSKAILLRGETLGAPRLQIGALAGLALAAAALGQWAEVADWSEQMRALAHAIGAPREVAYAQANLGIAAASMDEHAVAMGWYQQSLALTRADKDQAGEAGLLRLLGASALELGDAQGALQWHAQAQALHESLDQPVQACENLAGAALCQARLGLSESALATAHQVLERVSGELAERAAHETLGLRWHCQQVLDAAGDARAAPLLEQLFADVQTRAAVLTDAADRDRLIQALPVFRGVVAAQARGGAAR